MNSKQGLRYIKRRIGDDLKKQILVRNGIISENEIKKQPTIHLCPRCEFVNSLDFKYCSKCSYPLVPQAFEEIKESEEIKIKELETKYQNDIKELKEDMEKKFQTLLSRIEISKLA